MSYSFLESYRKHYVSEKVRLRRLKNEAKHRNCKVILHKTKIPMKVSDKLDKDECDQQVPIATDIGNTDPVSSSKEHEYYEEACGTCAKMELLHSETDQDQEARNIFQTLKSFSGIHQPPKTLSADSLFLCDLGNKCDSPKCFESSLGKESMETFIDVKIKQEETVEQFETNVEEKENSWCPLTPMSETEKDETLTPIVSDSTTSDIAVNDSQHNGETTIAKMPLIRECWSLAGTDLIWSNSCESTSDFSTNNLSESNPNHMMLSSTFETNANSSMELDSPIAQSDVFIQNTIHCTQNEESILCKPEEFHSEHLVDNVDRDLLHEQSNEPNKINSETVVEIVNQNDQTTAVLLSDDFSKASDSVDKHMDCFKETPNFSQLEQTKNEKCISTLNTDILNPLQENGQLSNNVNNNSDTEIIAPKQISSESCSSIHQLLDSLVGNIVASEKAQSEVFHTESPVNVIASPHHDDTVAAVPETVQNVENVPISNENINANTEEFHNDSSLTGNDIPTCNTNSNSITSPNRTQANMPTLEEPNTPLITHFIPIKRKRGRPKGRGKGCYSNKYTNYTGPYRQVVYNINSLNTINFSSIQQMSRQPGVNVPLELPSKGVIGMVSQETFSEIQKHQSVSEHTVPQTLDQNYPTKQGQTTGPNGGYVPICNDKVLELVKKPISNVDSVAKGSAQTKENLQIAPAGQLVASNTMIELQRPPPTYQLPTSSTSINTQETVQLPVQNIKNTPFVDNDNIIEHNAVQLGNESVLALPRNAMSSFPVPISIPKTRPRKRRNIKVKLTVREQLLRKINERKHSSTHNIPILPTLSTSQSPATHQLPHPAPILGQTSPTVTQPSPIPAIPPPHQLPQPPPTLTTPPPIPTSPSPNQLLLSPPKLTQPPPIPALPSPHKIPLSPPKLSPSAPHQLSQPLLAQPPLIVAQTKAPHQVTQPPALLAQHPAPHQLARLPPIQPQSLPSLRNPSPLPPVLSNIPHAGTRIIYPSYRHPSQTTGNQQFPIYISSTAPPVVYNHPVVTAPQYHFTEVLPILTSQPALTHNALNFTNVPLPSMTQFAAKNLSCPNNLSKNPISTKRLHDFANPPPVMNAALDLSMPSKRFYTTAPQTIEAVPLDLSKSSGMIPEVKCTPLDLSRKEPLTKLPNKGISEVNPQKVSIPSMEPPPELNHSQQYYKLDQNLSVLAAAAEMLEAKSVNTSNNVTQEPTTPKMSKLLVKFNQKRKLWHLVPQGKDSQRKSDVAKKIGKKARRGRPPIVRNVIKETTGGKIHNCQFCDFTHSQKSEVRLHIKIAHFAKFKKDPKTNNLRQVVNSFDVKCVNGKTNNQEVKFTPATFGKEMFHCKSCDFKANARYLLQRHVIKWHPTKTSYMCHSKDCAQTFPTIELLREHQLVHKKNQKYVCSICGASYHYMNGLRAHDARHHALLAYQCPNCGLKFKSQGMLQRHRIQKNHFKIGNNFNVDEETSNVHTNKFNVEKESANVETNNFV